MFSVHRPVSFSAQIGPYETFAELQAAAQRQIPGVVLIPPAPNATQGQIKTASGTDLGLWHSPPFTMVYPVSFTALTGPADTMDDLQIALSKEVPGALLTPPVKHLLKNANTGNVVDSQGRVIGQWYEGR